MEGDSGSASGAADCGPGRRHVTRAELIAVAANVLLREHGELVEVIGSPDVAGLESALVEDPPIVRHVLVGVMNQPLKPVCLQRLELFQRQPLRGLQFSHITPVRRCKSFQSSQQPVRGYGRVLKGDGEALIKALDEGAVVDHFIERLYKRLPVALQHATVSTYG